MTVHMPLTAAGRRAIFLVGFYIYMCNFPLIALARTLFSYSVVLQSCRGPPRVSVRSALGVLSSLLACANGVTSAVLVLAVLGLSLQRLRL